MFLINQRQSRGALGVIEAIHLCLLTPSMTSVYGRIIMCLTAKNGVLSVIGCRYDRVPYVKNKTLSFQLNMGTRNLFRS